MNMNKDTVLNILGGTFILFGVLSVINSIFILENYGQLVWVCTVSLFIMGYSVLKRHSYLLMSQICILFIPVLYWNVDFYYLLFSGDSLWGITNYFFEWDGIRNFGRIVTIYHLFSVPLALICLYLMKRDTGKRNEWTLSVIQVTVLFVLAKLLTVPEHNINCAFRACVPISIGLPHEVTWFILYFMMIGISYVFLNSFKVLKREVRR